MALTTSVFGLALAPVLVGALSSLTGSLVTAFYLVFPPVILGLMRCCCGRVTPSRTTPVPSSPPIYEENQLLEKERAEMEAVPTDSG